MSAPVLSFRFHVFAACVFVLMVSSELGFLIYSAYYWSQIRNEFSVVEHVQKCHIATLVSCSQNLWILSLIAPGLAPLAPAVSILLRTYPSACDKCRTEFYAQANNEFCQLFYVVRNETIFPNISNISASQSWENETWFLDWFRKRCDWPFKIIATFVGMSALAFVAVAGTLITIWATCKYPRPVPAAREVTMYTE
jgi:hypothetical protein